MIEISHFDNGVTLAVNTLPHSDATAVGIWLLNGAAIGVVSSTGNSASTTILACSTGLRRTGAALKQTRKRRVIGILA